MIFAPTRYVLQVSCHIISHGYHCTCDIGMILARRDGPLQTVCQIYFILFSLLTHLLAYRLQLPVACHKYNDTSGLWLASKLVYSCQTVFIRETAASVVVAKLQAKAPKCCHKKRPYVTHDASLVIPAACDTMPDYWYKKCVITYPLFGMPANCAPKVGQNILRYP